jgi:hypothetical protein
MPRPVTTSASDNADGRDPRFPPRRLGGGVEHAEPAFVADIVAAEFERVGLGHEGELVDRLLRREREREVERRAQRCALEIARPSAPRG